MFKRYTSCHGTKVYNINWIGAVVFLQILLCFVSIEPEQKNTGKNQPVVEITAPDSNRLMNFNLNETLSMYSRGNSNTDYKVVIGNNPKKPNKRNKHKTNNSNTSKRNFQPIPSYITR